MININDSCVVKCPLHHPKNKPIGAEFITRRSTIDAEQLPILATSKMLEMLQELFWLTMVTLEPHDKKWVSGNPTPGSGTEVLGFYELDGGSWVGRMLGAPWKGRAPLLYSVIPSVF